MKTQHSLLVGVLLILSSLSMNSLHALELSPSPELQTAVDQVVRDTLKEFEGKGLKADQLAVTVINLTATNQLLSASYRGDQRIYPASVVKLFYLLAAHQWMEDGKLQDSEEVRRAMRDMIVDSSNDATGYLLDLLTDTTSGPELPVAELEKWQDKRNAVNRYLVTQGYKNINVNRKPWGDGPYGRETQSIKVSAPNHRNWLTTDATARLMTQIALDKAVSPSRSAQMREILKRDPQSKTDRQALYTGVALPAGAKLWSKAGWTSQSRHDACYVELPDGRRFVLVVFTDGHASNTEIIPSVAKNLIARLPR
jgi:beta-lactamase class A